MDLRIRVGLALGAILLGTIVAAWLITAGGVVRSLIGELISERIDIAVYVAEQLEASERPRQRVEELADQLRIQVAVGPRPPTAMSRRARRVERDGREILVLRGPKAPIAVSMSPRGRERWLLVHFPADLDRPPRRIGIGLLLLLLGSLALGLLVLRQVFLPLQKTTLAMRRIADGELDHRLTVGGAVPEAERTFNQMADRVQSLVQGQRDLMAAVSHELRTPLSRMRLQLALLEDSADPRRVAELERDVGEVDELVEELLESARLHQGQLALQWGTVAAGDLAAEALGSVDLGNHPVHLDASPDLTFSADARRLLRCLRNLLSNVVRYTPPETPVAVSIIEDADSIVISVVDQGPGVDDAERARLFEPFYRTEASRSRRTGGLGLGLMLVRQIAEAHGGRAEALAPPGGGLAIRLVLPRNRASPPAADLG